MGGVAGFREGLLHVVGGLTVIFDDKNLHAVVIRDFAGCQRRHVVSSQRESGSGLMGVRCRRAGIED
jgi:hypothetical protein